MVGVHLPLETTEIRMTEREYWTRKPLRIREEHYKMTTLEYERLKDAAQAWLRLVEAKHSVDYEETSMRYYMLWNLD